jgi:hypothetical protein
MSTPLFFQRYANGAVPMAVTLNVAVWPAMMLWLAGCEVMAGASAPSGCASIPV